MTENALTITEEQALARLAQLDLSKPGGYKNVKREDIGRAPRIRISAENRPLTVGEIEIPRGHFANTMTGQDYGPEVEFVFLRFGNDTRVMWPLQYNADNDPLCASDDGITPSVGTPQRPLTSPQSGPCAQCPSAQFGQNGEAPRCKRQRNFLFWLVETQEPVLFTVQSTGLTPAQTLTNLALQAKYQTTIYANTVKMKNARGVWFVAEYRKGRPIKATLSLELYELQKSLATLDIIADLEAAGVVNGDESSDGEPVPF